MHEDHCYIRMLKHHPLIRKTLQNRKIVSILQMETWGTNKLNELPTVSQEVPAETETDPLFFSASCRAFIETILLSTVLK